jgi:TetR/AcrR family fatty acid metabolism transcriptional regulator
VRRRVEDSGLVGMGGAESEFILANRFGFIRVAPADISGARRTLKQRKTGSADRTKATSLVGTPATGPGSEKYQRILDAAVEVIAEHGYFRSPVSAIAKRAGVADGTVYLYFKSKDDVLRTAIDTTFNKFHKQVDEKFQTLKGPREQLEYIAQVHLESHAVNRSMAVLMQTEVRQSAKFIAEFSHHHLVKYIQVVREVVRRGQQEGIFRRDVSDGVVAHCMFGAIDELLSSAVFTGRVYDAKSTAAQVMDVLLHGITATGKS